MAVRSVPDASVRDNNGALRDDPRRCEECGEEFLARRSDQRFCATGSCRQRWHRRVLAAGRHRCSVCGLEHTRDGAAVS